MTDHTQPQAGDQREESRRLSLAAAKPPTDVPGYQPQRLLGTGAYGEVWVALDRTTGRRVAIKFYTHRGGLDWSLLSREVEKLAFLSADRYVVQLLDVGWDANPPYYVMEYIENGSLEERIAARGPLDVEDAVSLFREIAVGLLHAHAKGVLHCDLKPANVLVDEDGRPRLADFGQSRLSHEQTPALGTLFYMAPEQADLKAIPDARWDVYALGAVLHAMLTGKPPHQDERLAAELAAAGNLEERLARYRDAIRRSPLPQGHRKARGVDRELADLLDSMLQSDPRLRLANVQAVLDGLATREQRRARRPLVVLGALGPALVLLVAALFGWLGFRYVLREFNESLTARALKENQFAAGLVARAAADELNRRFRAVEQLAADPELRTWLRNLQTEDQFKRLATVLNNPELGANPEEVKTARAKFLQLTLVKHLQKMMESAYESPEQPRAASWFVTDVQGLQVARSPMSRTVGQNFAWRTYFTGEKEERPRTWRPPKHGGHITGTHLSTVFRSQASGQWVVTISRPVYESDDAANFLGILALTVEVGGFAELRGGSGNQFGVLVDLREGRNRGLILQHPIYDQFRQRGEPVPHRVTDIRLTDDGLPLSEGQRRNYRDPFATDPAGGRFASHYLASMAPVEVRHRNLGDQATGWQAIVQQSYGETIGEPLDNLRRRLVTWGLVAVVLSALVISLLWALVLWGIYRRRRSGSNGAAGAASGTPSDVTLPDMSAMRRK